MAQATRKMTPISSQLLSELVATRSPVCLSLYQPTHRRHPENQQDPIRFRNLVKDLEVSLLNEHPLADARLLLAPFSHQKGGRFFTPFAWIRGVLLA